MKNYKKLTWKFWKWSIDQPYFASIITHNLSNTSSNTLRRWTVLSLCSCWRAGLHNHHKTWKIIKKLTWKFWKWSVDKPYFASIITHNLSNTSSNTLRRWTVLFLCSCSRAGLHNHHNTWKIINKLTWKFWKWSIDQPYFASIITPNLSNTPSNTLRRWTVLFLCSCSWAGLHKNHETWKIIKKLTWKF